MSVPKHVRAVFKDSTCLYSKIEVEAALDRMATSISYELSDSNPILLCVVVGGIVALGNLLPRLDFPLEVDYVHATRYGKNLVGQGVQWIVEPKVEMAGRTIIVVDDILDGGVTLKEIVDYCENKGASSVHSAVLVDKRGVRLPEGLPEADFCGLEVGDSYVFGYGLDYKGYLRNAPGIYSVSAEHAKAG